MGCEMTSDVDLRQSEEMVSLIEVSDEALEAVCGGLLGGSPTLAFGSYCFTCRPHFALSTASDTLLDLNLERFGCFTGGTSCNRCNRRGDSNAYVASLDFAEHDLP
jgi:hypothetical protein